MTSKYKMHLGDPRILQFKAQVARCLDLEGKIHKDQLPLDDVVEVMNDIKVVVNFLLLFAILQVNTVGRIISVNAVMFIFNNQHLKGGHKVIRIASKYHDEIESVLKAQRDGKA